MPSLKRDEFIELATGHARSGDAAPVDGAAGGAPGVGTLLIPVGIRVLGDQLTPVLAYRRLVSGDARTAPSFLLESVENGTQLGRYSILGARPAVEVQAFGTRVQVTDASAPGAPSELDADPFEVMRGLSSRYELVVPEGAVDSKRLPACALGGWFGYAGYDTVRYAEPEKLSVDRAPGDDRGLADLHFGLYGGVVVFDHVDTVVHVVALGAVPEGADAARAGEAYDRALAEVRRVAGVIQEHSKPLALGELSSRSPAPEVPASNMTRAEHRAMVEKARAYIEAGDIFQVVVGQRFERTSGADPFDVYRALRAVNPSPYMVYLQAPGCILVASSPEILCRVQRDDAGLSVVTNRPLAGTRKRGRTAEEDAALERELLADEKERAEHVMLVDLGRNDVGRVAAPGTVSLDAVMEIERYSHVMHISSTVTGTLRDGVDAWDALRATLPVGTISGAPKIRAMQIIDELEPVRRGPYGGGLGYAGLDGQMDIALALRTIVVPTDRFVPDAGGAEGDHARGAWTYHLQAAGGIVYDSDPDAEFMETVNKAMALVRAIDAAERAFG